MKIPRTRKNIHGTACPSFLIILILLPFFLYIIPLQADDRTAEKREMLLAIEKVCKFESGNSQQKSLCRQLINFKNFLSNNPVIFLTLPLLSSASSVTNSSYSIDSVDSVDSVDSLNPFYLLTDSAMIEDKIRIVLSDIIFSAGNIEDTFMTESLLEIYLKYHPSNTGYPEEKSPYDRVAYPTFNSFLFRKSTDCLGPPYCESPGYQEAITVKSPTSGEILHENLDREIKKFTITYGLKDILLFFGLDQYQSFQHIAIKMIPGQAHQIRMPVSAEPVAAYSMIPKDWHLLSPMATAYTFTTPQHDIIMIIVSREHINNINRKSSIYGNIMKYEEGDPLPAGTLTGNIMPDGEAIVILLIPPELSLYNFNKKDPIRAGDAVAKLTSD